MHFFAIIFIDKRGNLNEKIRKKDYLLIGTLFIPMVTLIIYLLCKGYIFGSNIDWANQHIVLPEYFRNLFYSNGKIIPSLLLI